MTEIISINGARAIWDKYKNKPVPDEEKKALKLYFNFKSKQYRESQSDIYNINNQWIELVRVINSLGIDCHD